MTRRKGDGPPRRYWSRIERREFRKIYPALSNTEIATRLGRTLMAINGMASTLRLKKSAEYLRRHCRIQKGQAIGRAFQFPKGHVPANKGLRRPGYSPGRMKETQFKKGQSPHNSQPVGAVLADSEGYLRIKVRERKPGDAPGWNPEIWPCVHHQVWREHKGPIPPKYIVVFKDRNRQNCAIENLECISLAENMRRNTIWNVYPPELANVIQTLSGLKRKIRSMTNGKK